MRVWSLGGARSVIAIGVLAGTVSCSGAGSGSAPGASPGLPETPTSSTAAGSAARASNAVATRGDAAATAASDASDALLASSGDIAATDIAALDVPPTSDVAPVGDATDAIEYNWNLTGTYSGIIKQWTDGVESRGTFSFSIVNTPPKPFFGGHGTIVVDGASSDALMQGRIVKTYQHSVALIYSMSFGPGETCYVTGVARRYRHVFEGVLKSPPGGAECPPDTAFTIYFKVRPGS